MVKEDGKCLTEAMDEIDYGLGFVEWYSEEMAGPRAAAKETVL